MTFSATGSIFVKGIIFPGNASRTNPVPCARVENGSYIAICDPLLALVWLKLPSRCSAVGTELVVLAEARSRRPSKLPSKKVLFLTIGPFTIAPNWFRLKLPGACPCRLLQSSLRSQLRVPHKLDQATEQLGSPLLVHHGHYASVAAPNRGGIVRPQHPELRNRRNRRNVELPENPFTAGCAVLTPSTRMSSI